MENPSNMKIESKLMKISSAANTKERVLFVYQKTAEYRIANVRKANTKLRKFGVRYAVSIEYPDKLVNPTALTFFARKSLVRYLISENRKSRSVVHIVSEINQNTLLLVWRINSYHCGNTCPIHFLNTPSKIN